MAITIASGMRLTPARLNALIPLVARKTSDETVNNTATYQDDNELLLTLEPNAAYLGHLHMMFLSGTTPDFKYQFTYPAGVTLPEWSFVIGPTGSQQTGEAVNGGVTGINGTGANSPIDAWGLVIVGSTGGTLRVQWAQNAANASNTTVRAGSFLRLQRYS